jgi:hypothetical protein
MNKILKQIKEEIFVKPVTLFDVAVYIVLYHIVADFVKALSN